MRVHREGTSPNRVELHIVVCFFVYSQLEYIFAFQVSHTAFSSQSADVEESPAKSGNESEKREREKGGF